MLIPMPLADTLLRLAEDPRLYWPKWSRTILEEVTRNLIAKWGVPMDKALWRESQLIKAFPEALVGDIEAMLPRMGNDPGDRHVLAAAVQSEARTIVTYNRRHFPDSALDPWGVEALGPSDFLLRLHRRDPGLFERRLREQAEGVGASMDWLLSRLAKNVPGFAQAFSFDRRVRRAG